MIKTKKTIKDMHELAKSRGFEFISKKFTKMSLPHWWKCKNGHKWKTPPSGIRAGWGCPYCKSNVSEEKCRFIFESLTMQRFEKTRRILGKNLELDGYCKKLKLAFEHQGKQHYEPIYYYKDKKRFQNQKKRDKLKKELCLNKKINLIIIPYTVSKNIKNLEDFIKNKLTNYKIKNTKIDWSKFRMKTKLEEIRDLAKKSNVTCLTNFYIDSSTQMDFVCNKCGYSWKTIPQFYNRLIGCRKCKKVAKLTIEEIRLMCAERNIEFLDCIYKSLITYHNFRCMKCNHIWTTQVQCVKNAKECPKCAIKTSAKLRKEKYGKKLYEKMWITLRQKYGPTGRRKRFSDEERRERRRQSQRKYDTKMRKLRKEQSMKTIS